MLVGEPHPVDHQHAARPRRRRCERGADERDAAADPASAAHARAGGGADPAAAAPADPDDHLRRAGRHERGRAAVPQAGAVRVRRRAHAVPARERARRPVSSLVALASRRPWRVLAVVGLLVVAGAVPALRLPVSAGTSTLVSGSSDAGGATSVAHSRFGDEAIYVLVRGDLPRLVLTSDLNRLLGLEGCLSGNVPAGATPPGGDSGPCAALARSRAVQVVYGPGTFINSSVEELTKQLQAQTRARAAQADRAREAARKLALSQGRSAGEARQLGAQAEKLVYAEFARELLALNAKYGLSLRGAPKVNDPNFVYQLVFDPARGARAPKARFSYLFPSADSALISVRLKAGLSDEQRARAVRLVREAAAMDEFKLESGGRYVVTGVPVLAGDLTDVLA